MALGQMSLGQVTLREGGGGGIFKYPPQRRILKIPPLKILGKFFEKQGTNSEI